MYALNAILHPDDPLADETCDTCGTTRDVGEIKTGRDQFENICPACLASRKHGDELHRFWRRFRSSKMRAVQREARARRDGGLRRDAVVRRQAVAA